MLSPSAPAAGLQTSYSDVFQKNVRLGSAQDVPGPMGKGLLLKNLGDAPLRVRAQVLKPASDQLLDGAEPIPDPAWVQLVPDHLDLAAHAEGAIQVLVHVPPERPYQARQYQFMIWSRGELVGQSGVQVSAGLLSRVRIVTAAHE